jgi:hypothetical protein
LQNRHWPFPIETNHKWRVENPPGKPFNYSNYSDKSPTSKFFQFSWPSRDLYCELFRLWSNGIDNKIKNSNGFFYSDLNVKVEAKAHSPSFFISFLEIYSLLWLGS